jgi:Family of unknown function (DUF6152)
LKNRIFIITAALSIAMGAATTLLAHHSPSAIFNMKELVTLKGTVTKVDWVNPHIVMYMDVKDDAGKIVNWKFESNPPRWFTKVGVNRADFAAAIDKTVSVVIVAAIDGSKYGYLRRITFPNGDAISLEAGEKEEIRP